MYATTSEKLDPRLFSSDGPSSEKLFVLLERVDNEYIDVTLLVPLDPRRPTEAIAEKSFGSPLRVQHRVNMNIEQEHIRMKRMLSELYLPRENNPLMRDPPIPLTNVELCNRLHPLAEKGRSIAHRIFNIEVPLSHDRSDTDLLSGAVKSSISRSQTLVFDSLQQLFPWALLYWDTSLDSSRKNSVNPKNFFGFKHIIQTVIRGMAPRFLIPDKPMIMAAICRDTDKGYHSCEGHPFLALKEQIVYVDNVDELGRQLTHFAGDCIYFYGHAEHSDPPVRDENRLLLRRVPLTVDTLVRDYKAPFFEKELVVVFLNGCDTAQLHDWNENTITGFFFKRGNFRVCCLATVAEVPIWFAAHFARHFWAAFLIQRRTIGSALLQARLAMLETWSNPLGLVYNLFGRVDTRLNNSLRDNT